MLPRQLGFEGLMMPSPRSMQGNKDETSESPTADEDKDEKKVNEVSQGTKMTSWDVLGSLGLSMLKFDRI